LETLFEKWVFVLKNLSRLMERPAALQERVFNRLFEAASITRFTPKQLREYEDSVKAYRDIVNAVNTARKEGREEGLEKRREEERIGIAQNLKAMGLDMPAIQKATGLTLEEIRKL
ncbi:PD-(D/E)XK nuclease family transposase, partial [Bacteroides congonensis]|uniref:PD-(D/E)XK nuclease family transposase n=1 Tax=Bacteroides congonensis TaxID=1871006 RepID=UPI0026755D65